MIRSNFTATAALSLSLSLSLSLLAATTQRSTAAVALHPDIASSAGAVYVASNNATTNEVLAYKRGADGKLTYLATYLTGGRGSDGAIDPLQSQHSVLLSDDHRFLFVVNSGSGNISVFRVCTDGKLSLIEFRPSGGGFPDSLAVQGDLLYALNSGGAGSICGFHIAANGDLDPIKGSLHLLSAPSAGGASIDISPDGKELAATERLTSLIDIFPLDSNGAAGVPVENASYGKTPFSLTFTPQGPLVVTQAPTVGDGAISSYNVRSNNGLSVITGSATTGFVAACWVEASPDGNYVYVSNPGGGTISTASVSDDGSLDVLRSIGTGTGSAPLDLSLAGNGRFLFALTAGAGTISEFQVEANGKLISLGAIKSLPAASGQNGLAAY